MTPRRSERELERSVDGLKPDSAAGARPESILYQDPVSGEYRTMTGGTVDPTTAELDPVMIIETVDLPAPKGSGAD